MIAIGSFPKNRIAIAAGVGIILLAVVFIVFSVASSPAKEERLASNQVVGSAHNSDIVEQEPPGLRPKENNSDGPVGGCLCPRRKGRKQGNNAPSGQFPPDKAAASTSAAVRMAAKKLYSFPKHLSSVSHRRRHKASPRTRIVRAAEVEGARRNPAGTQAKGRRLFRRPGVESSITTDYLSSSLSALSSSDLTSVAATGADFEIAPRGRVHRRRNAPPS